jgi:pyruvate/2-oxoglutarate dehydrogenase complex dihydrolipoamide dehydrogenase (E3) component
VPTGRQVSSAFFTDLESARIGLSETEAKQKESDYRVAAILMAAVLRPLKHQWRRFGQTFLNPITFYI